MEFVLWADYEYIHLIIVIQAPRKRLNVNSTVNSNKKIYSFNRMPDLSKIYIFL